MSRLHKQLIIGLLFVSMLGWVWYRSQSDLQTSPTGLGSAREGSSQEAQERYGFSLSNVAQECGIKFEHQSARLDAKLDHIMPIVAGMGAGVTISDF